MNVSSTKYQVSNYVMQHIPVTATTSCSKTCDARLITHQAFVVTRTIVLGISLIYEASKYNSSEQLLFHNYSHSIVSFQHLGKDRYIGYRDLGVKVLPFPLDLQIICSTELECSTSHYFHTTLPSSLQCTCSINEIHCLEV